MARKKRRRGVIPMSDNIRDMLLKRIAWLVSKLAINCVLDLLERFMDCFDSFK